MILSSTDFFGMENINAGQELKGKATFSLTTAITYIIFIIIGGPNEISFEYC